MTFKRSRWHHSVLIFPLIMVFLPHLSLPLNAADDSSAADPAHQSVSETGPENVEVVADQLEYDRQKGKVIAKGNVVLRYRETQVTADYGEVETEAKKAYVRGHVVIFKLGLPVARGEEITYDFDKESGTFPGGRTINGFWYGSGDDIRQIKKGLKVIRKGAATTCDLDKPHYNVRAKKITIYEGDKLIAQNVFIRVLGRPIFWWPYLIIPLQRRSHPPLALSGGYNSRHGYYLKTRKGISLAEKIWGTVRADWRSRRGFGAGGDIDYDYSPYAMGNLKAYLTQDRNAPTTSLDNPYSDSEERLRGALTWRHRTDFNDSNFAVFRYNRFADEFFLQDFSEVEFRAETEPQSFATFTRLSDRYTVLTHFEKRMNPWESPVERMPQIRLNWKNQPFFTPRLYYQSELNFDNLTKRFGRLSYDEDVVRADQYNEWSLPLRWREFQFTPFTSLRETLYSRDRESSDSHFRVVFGEGVDLRTQFYRTFPVSFHKWGVESNQLRHVVEPSIRLEGTQSTVSDETLNHFDSIDKIDDAHLVTFGLENRIQTKRVLGGRMQRVDILSLNTFLSYELHPDGESKTARFTSFNDGPTGSSLTILSQEVVARPYEWLQYQLQTDYDMNQDAFRVINNDVLFRLNPVQLIFGHRYIKGIGDIKGSGQLVFNGTWTVNPRWKVGGYIRWDTNEEGLEEWQISATRDLHCALLDFGYNVRNSAIDSSSKELYFVFYLKAFPQYDLHSGSKASFSEPRLGDTVMGAN